MQSKPAIFQRMGKNKTAGELGRLRFKPDRKRPYCLNTRGAPGNAAEKTKYSLIKDTSDKIMAYYIGYVLQLSREKGGFLLHLFNVINFLNNDYKNTTNMVYGRIIRFYFSCRCGYPSCKLITFFHKKQTPKTSV